MEGLRPQEKENVKQSSIKKDITASGRARKEKKVNIEKELKDNKNKDNKIKKRNIDGQNENFIVPLEIDTHFQLYGKHMWEIDYTERCPICEKRIDEFGYCACNSYSE